MSEQIFRYNEINRQIRACASELGNEVPLHWHTYYEVEMITCGRLTHMINGVSFTAERGSAAILTPRDFHKYNRIDGCCKVKKFIFQNNYLTDMLINFLNELSLPCAAVFNNAETEKIEVMFDYIISNFESTDSITRLNIRNTAERICIMILENNSKNHMFMFERSNSFYDDIDRFKPALDYISENLSHPISMEQAAKTVHMSTNYFSHLFRRTFNISYSEYLKAKRLQYAAGILLSCCCSVEEIAFDSGFASISFFNRSFKKQYKMTPLQYRKQFTPMLELSDRK